MRIGEVIEKEREKARLSAEHMAQSLELSVDEYEQMETGESPIEIWGPIHAWIAIKLEKPMSRFVAPSGKTTDAQPGQFGQLLKTRREERGKSSEELAQLVKEGAVDYAKETPPDRTNWLRFDDGPTEAEQRAELLASEVATLADDFASIEAGESEMEIWAPRLLRCAEIIKLPVFNFIYPCGLPAPSLEDYP